MEMRLVLWYSIAMIGYTRIVAFAIPPVLRLPQPLYPTVCTQKIECKILQLAPQQQLEDQ